jgi:hypothetical protein
VVVCCIFLSQLEVGRREFFNGVLVVIIRDTKDLSGFMYFEEDTLRFIICNFNEILSRRQSHRELMEVPLYLPSIKRIPFETS